MIILGGHPVPEVWRGGIFSEDLCPTTSTRLLRRFPASAADPATRRIGLHPSMRRSCQRHVSFRVRPVPHFEPGEGTWCTPCHHLRGRRRRHEDANRDAHRVDIRRTVQPAATGRATPAKTSTCRPAERPHLPRCGRGRPCLAVPQGESRLTSRAVRDRSGSRVGGRG